VHSTEFAKHLILKREILPKKIVELPPGISSSFVDKVKKYCMRKKKKKSKEVIVGFLGLLAKWQGVDILCDIVAELNRRGYRAKLKVIGDGPLRRFLMHKCRSLGVEVEITGFISHQKALCLARREFDVLVLPRIKTETTSSIIPIKIIEALALEVPVIATDLLVYKKFEGRGLYTSKRTPKHFADTILKILTNPSNADINSYLQKYLYELNVRRFLRIALGDRT
ncbi:MAG: glycosyltransferase family 4 protein, partial [Staphylothermus sp.]|nr:glycosyltransferase family 4 protein [Staphylothermus sp.]